MAYGTDSDQFVIMTKVKKGLKREFEFALKSQSQISGTMRRTRNGGNGGISESEEKRLRREEKEREEDVEVDVVGEQGVVAAEGKGVGSTASGDSIKSGVLDPASEEDRKSDGFSRQKVEKTFLHYVRTKKKSKGTETADSHIMNDENSNSESEHEVEKEGSSKVKLCRVPKNLKEFLETGLLEGVHVKYQRYLKVHKAYVELYQNYSTSGGYVGNVELVQAKEAGEESGLNGVIKGTGILCFCNECKGVKVVRAHVFECHAGSSNKRPPEYIILDNGKSLRDVMNACQDVPAEVIEETIQKAIGSAPQSLPAVSESICGSHGNISPFTPISRNHVAPVSKRSAEEAVPVKCRTRVSSDAGSSRSKSEGKVTKKDLGLHKLVFQNDILPDGTEVGYFSNQEKLRGGYKSGIGICCDCCNTVISPSQFEAHAGRGSHRKPFHNIYLSNGLSLHELAIKVSLNGGSVRENDKLCKICGKGGDLIWCGGCPRSFHKECASSLTRRNGILFCRTCVSNQKGKFDNANAIAAGRVAGVDHVEQVVNRSIRIIQVGEVEIGGCILCRSPTFDKKFGPQAVIICDQCEREYHVGCLKDHGIADLQEEPKGDWFCCQECGRIKSSLNKLMATGGECLPDSLLSSIQIKSGLFNDSGSGDRIVVKWRILSGKTISEENKPLLLTAVDILQENFGIIVDPATNIDLIPAMVNGVDLQSQDFGGMHCAVLSVNSAVVSVAVFRIRGMELAEMPLVATSSKAHGQGYFQTLYACLERYLGFLKVKKIVLPAADGAEAIWTNKFGFIRMSEAELKTYMNDYHLMNFQGLPWFKRAVPKIRITS